MAHNSAEDKGLYSTREWISAWLEVVTKGKACMGRLLGRKVLEKEQESQKDTMALGIPWLELHASTTGRTGFIPGWGTKSSHVMW